MFTHIESHGELSGALIKMSSIKQHLVRCVPSFTVNCQGTSSGTAEAQKYTDHIVDLQCCLFIFKILIIKQKVNSTGNQKM